MNAALREQALIEGSRYELRELPLYQPLTGRSPDPGELPQWSGTGINTSPPAIGTRLYTCPMGGKRRSGVVSGYFVETGYLGVYVLLTVPWQNGDTLVKEAMLFGAELSKGALS